jgi:hypothetical protein
MIGTSYPSTSTSSTSRSAEQEGSSRMDLLSKGTFVGAGSFCCRNCGYVLTLNGLDTLTDCPGCGGSDFVRASLFSAEGESTVEQTARHGMLAEPAPQDREELLARARASIEQPGEYLCIEEGAELRVVPLAREWTRIGRSLAADVRFDDPTVSRRHALIVRQPDGVRVLDDRSLNGVFVNGERIEGKLLQDGDEIIVGRYRLGFVAVTQVHRAGAGSETPSTPGAGS